MKQQYLFPHIYKRLAKKQAEAVKAIINQHGLGFSDSMTAYTLTAVKYLKKPLLRKWELSIMDSSEVRYAHYCFQSMVWTELRMIELTGGKKYGGLIGLKLVMA